MMKYDIAVFDLDGTILDTLEDLKNSVNYALEKNGLPKRTREEIRSFVGNGIRLLIERAVPENTDLSRTDAVFGSFKEYYGKHSADNTKPYNGVEELLLELKTNGVKLAVVSNKADFAVQALVKEYFPDTFDYAVGEKEGIRRKPYPDSVFSALKNLGNEKSKAIYIGDSEVDIETAENSGIDCISVVWGFRDYKLLKSLEPEYIVNKPSEILNIILGE